MTGSVPLVQMSYHVLCSTSTLARSLTISAARTEDHYAVLQLARASATRLEYPLYVTAQRISLSSGDSLQATHSLRHTGGVVHGDDVAVRLRVAGVLEHRVVVQERAPVLQHRDAVVEPSERLCDRLG